MKRHTLIIIFLISLTLGACGQKNKTSNQTQAEKITIENCDLKNIYKIDDGVYRSEQPSSSDFKSLERYGIKEVLSLRNYNDDDRESRGTSITTHTLRTRASQINEDDLIEALRIIKNRKGDILFHCWHGSDRTGAVCAIYRIVFQDWSKEKAIDEMVNGGFGFHKNQFGQIIDMIQSADIDRIKRELSIK